MQVNPYLNFDGQTEEAFNFYKSVFGGEFTRIQRFKDIPKSAQKMPKTEANRIMHIALPIGQNTLLMGTDISEGMGMKLELGNNMYISLHPKTLEESKRIFEQLSSGGKVELPFQKMFWGDYFASFTDKFGINWMLNYHQV